MNKAEDKVFKKYKYMLVDLMVGSKGEDCIKSINSIYTKLKNENNKLIRVEGSKVYFGDVTYDKSKLFYVELGLNSVNKTLESINVINKTESGILKVYSEGRELKTKTLLRMPNNVIRQVDLIKGGYK